VLLGVLLTAACPPPVVGPDEPDACADCSPADLAEDPPGDAAAAPVVWPNAVSASTSDPWIVENHDRISVMRPRIMALNGVQAGETAALLGAEIVPVLNTLAQVALWRAAAPGAPAAVHIDTGMNRLGLPLDAVGAAAEALGDQKLALVMSHLACGEDPAHPLNERQRARFQVAQEAFGPAQRSLAASAGAFMGERYRYDLVRPGLALYGGDPFAAPGPELLAVARITAPILQVRDVAAGESFGYGATAVAEAPMRTATVAIGYADGFLRAAAGRGYASRVGGTAAGFPATRVVGATPTGGSRVGIWRATR